MSCSVAALTDSAVSVLPRAADRACCRDLRPGSPAAVGRKAGGSARCPDGEQLPAVAGGWASELTVRYRLPGQALPAGSHPSGTSATIANCGGGTRDAQAPPPAFASRCSASAARLAIIYPLEMTGSPSHHGLAAARLRWSSSRRSAPANWSDVRVQAEVPPVSGRADSGSPPTSSSQSPAAARHRPPRPIDDCAPDQQAQSASPEAMYSQPPRQTEGTAGTKSAACTWAAKSATGPQGRSTASARTALHAQRSG